MLEYGCYELIFDPRRLIRINAAPPNVTLAPPTAAEDSSVHLRRWNACGAAGLARCQRRRRAARDSLQDLRVSEVGVCLLLSLEDYRWRWPRFFFFVFFLVRRQAGRRRRWRGRGTAGGSFFYACRRTEWLSLLCSSPRSCFVVIVPFCRVAASYVSQAESPLL